jgi:hypothetical protein
MPHKLTPYDIKVLRYIRDPVNYKDPEIIPGAALWLTATYLKSCGYTRITPDGKGGMTYFLTDKGIDFLDNES